MPAVASDFWEHAEVLADDRRTDRFSRLHGQVVMKTPGRVWQEVTFCSECGHMFTHEETIFHDEINNVIHCKACCE